jgi:DNA-binding CsgD family transcriptional regulator
LPELGEGHGPPDVITLGVVDSHRTQLLQGGLVLDAFGDGLDLELLRDSDDLDRDVEQAWARLLDTGCVVGRYQVVGRDGSWLDIVCCSLADVVPGLHLIAFAPADWPEHELDPVEDDQLDASASLTPRELEVVALAAEGHSGPELAQELVLSPATVNTHLKNIYRKLEVRTRAAAVAKAMRLGVID